MQKKYSIRIDGVEVPVDERIYTEYKRSVWNERRRRRYRLKVERSLEARSEAGYDVRSADKLVDDIVCDRELLALLFKALHALTEDERSLITAMFFEEKTSREIAAHTGIPQSTILYRKNKILQKMKKIFD